MQIEYEAKFPEIDKGDVRKRLREAGAFLVKPEFLQKRTVFHMPDGHVVEGGYVRVRYEGDRTTVSLKVIDGERIEDQREICLTVDNFEKAEVFLKSLGCRKKAYQETKRELWRLDGVEVTIDEWPFLEPFVEIEGGSETVVKEAAEKLGFDYSKAVFGAVDTLLLRKYPHLTADGINNQTPLIIFEGKNPFDFREK
jgi:adenylate cyclase class 2